jgi:hypothetical protein
VVQQQLHRVHQLLRAGVVQKLLTLLLPVPQPQYILAPSDTEMNMQQERQHHLPVGVAQELPLPPRLNARVMTRSQMSWKMNLICHYRNYHFIPSPI